MAPEIWSKQTYKGANVDMFACAVILFCFMLCESPFNKAMASEDELYRYLCEGRADKFWKHHLESKDKKSYSTEFKDLITNMMAENP